MFPASELPQVKLAAVVSSPRVEPAEKPALLAPETNPLRLLAAQPPLPPTSSVKVAPALTATVVAPVLP